MQPVSEPLAKKVTDSVRKMKGPRNVEARSAITNGRKQFLGKANERGEFARRLFDVTANMIDDLSGGAGGEALSEAQISMVRRAGVLQLSLEAMEADMANDKPVNLDMYARLAGHLRRIFETIGLRRVAKDVTPLLHNYVKQHPPHQKTAASTKDQGASSLLDYSREVETEDRGE
jgi:hypothetical protein